VFRSRYFVRSESKKKKKTINLLYKTVVKLWFADS
jgi:hypothetical protein